MIVYSFDNAFSRGIVECGECGALVTDPEQHTRWHESTGR